MEIQLAAARFFSICRLRSRARLESVSLFAFSRNASRPPLWSTDLIAFAETRSFTPRPSVSEIIVTLHRFGRKRRLVLMLEWLTLWPTCTPLAVSSQRRDMAKILDCIRRRTRRSPGSNSGPFEGTADGIRAPLPTVKPRTCTKIPAKWPLRIVNTHALVQNQRCSGPYKGRNLPLNIIDCATCWFLIAIHRTFGPV